MEAKSTLREARTAARLSQRRLAALSRVPQSAIARIESGRVIPRIDTLARLIGACGWTMTAGPRPGFGVDRTLIRMLLALTPDERVVWATESSKNVASLLAEIRGAR